MKTQHFESRLDLFAGNDVVITTTTNKMVLGVEGADGRLLMAHLTPAEVHDLKAMIANWERLYYDGQFES